MVYYNKYVENLTYFSNSLILKKGHFALNENKNHLT